MKNPILLLKWLKKFVLQGLGMDKPANSVLNEYLPYFESRDASDSIERAVVAMYSRGNTSLSKGLYLTETQYEKQLEFVSKCDLTPIGQAS